MCTGVTGFICRNKGPSKEDLGWEQLPGSVRKSLNLQSLLKFRPAAVASFPGKQPFSPDT